MQLPAQSPDLNPIEHILDQTGLFISDIKNLPVTVGRLREALLQAWGTVTPERMEVLVWSMPLQLRVVMAARGGHTDINSKIVRPNQLQCSLKISIQFSLRFV